MDVKMSVLEAMAKKDWSQDFDCCQSLTDELWMCFPTGIEVTEEGREDWADVLGLDVIIDFGNYVPAEIQVGKSCKLAKRVGQLIASANGYCPADDFDRWFRVKV